jgi:hypothetical protein
LYHLRARQYDPANGRFLTLDPLAQGLAQASISPYVYASDRPTFLTDPSGLCNSIANELLRACLKSAAGAGVLWLLGPEADLLALAEVALSACYQDALVTLISKVNPTAGRVVKIIIDVHSAWNIGKNVAGNVFRSAPRIVAPVAEQPIRAVYHLGIPGAPSVFP